MTSRLGKGKPRNLFLRCRMKNSKIAYCSTYYLLDAPVYVKGARWRGGGVTDPYKNVEPTYTLTSHRINELEEGNLVIGHFSSAVLDGRGQYYSKKGYPFNRMAFIFTRHSAYFLASEFFLLVLVPFVL